MCGICGIYDRQEVNREELARMLGRISHRGPDDQGIFVDGAIGLGNRRLSIIDLAGGNQPICNEDGTIWIVQNGEIYNYKQLRQMLEQRGHLFRTHSDTEVILHLYEDLGEDCLAQLRGMYAFAIWDAPQHKLFLARDRIGQKPLFYFFDGHQLLFASEPKAILAVQGHRREMDLSAIHDYLSLRFIPSPRTMFEQVKKIPPAHFLVFQHGQVKIQRYWELSFRDKVDQSEGELLESLRNKLKEVLSLHVVSDVEVGAFLSGGLDSSMIVALLSKELQQKPKTFSIGVEDGTFNELPYARQVAEYYSTQHVEERVAADLIHSLPKMIWHLDEPSDPIAACMFQAAQLASRHVKVALGGDGGDEAFAGFDRYVGYRYINAYRLMPDLLRRNVIGPLLDWIPESFSYKSTTQKMRWVHQLALQSSPAAQYAEATCFFRFNHQDKQALYSPGLWRQLGEINSSSVILEPFNSDQADDLLDRMLYTDYVTRLPEHSLMITDRMSMAHGLEARSPLLDHELVEFLARVPSEVKVQKGRPKYLFRRLAAQYLPESIVNRDKQGFMFPIADWFRAELYPFLERMLVSSFFVREGLFREDAVQRLLDEHRNGQFDHHMRLWMLLNLEIWHQLYIEQNGLEIVKERLRYLCLPQ